MGIIYHLTNPNIMLNIGDQLPDFSLPNQKGETIHSSSFLGKPLVIYFYPKDDTAGCTAQACNFRDHFEDFKQVGAEVVGISSDSVDSHQKFAHKHHLPFVLLSDTNGEVRKLFAVPRSFLGLIAGRVTYIFDAKGKLVHSFNSQIRIEQHIKEALLVLEKSQS